MKKLLLIAATSFAVVNANAQCSEIFFSEYLEGASNNKAVEVYNPTSSALNMTNYVFYRYNNGSPTPTDSLFPQGILAPGDVWVAGNPSAVSGILSQSDTLHTITFFNGDDVLSIKNISTGLLVDIIGIIGVDPGTNWPVGTGATSEFTLVRNVAVQQGTTNWAIAATQYDVYPQNTTSFLGSHTMNACCSGSVVAQLQSSSNINCFGDSTGTATVSATGTGLTYAWSPYGGTAATASNLIAGTFTCIVTDPCASADTVTVTLTQSAYLDTINVVEGQISCNGLSDGSLTINGNGGVGPYSYLWSNGDTTNISSGLSAGTYSFTITDALGCTRSLSWNITEPSALTVSSASTDVLCNGAATGTATITVNGGTPAYTYLWSQSSTSASVTNLTAGTYSCTATDANGCTISASTTVSEPTAIVINLDSVNNPAACGSQDGSIVISVSGGVAGYTYLWSNNSTSPNLSGVGAGTYNVTVTDNNGCTSVIGAALNDPNAPVVTWVNIDTLLCYQPSTIVLSGVTPSGGTFSGPGVTGNQFDVMVAGPGFHVITYTYVDSAGCTGFASDTIEVSFCIGVQESIATEMTLFPNPTAGELTIRSTQTGFTYRLFDALGKEVMTIRNASANETIDLSDFSEGVYVLRGENGTTVITKRVVISR